MKKEVENTCIEETQSYAYAPEITAPEATVSCVLSTGDLLLASPLADDTIQLTKLSAKAVPIKTISMDAAYNVDSPPHLLPLNNGDFIVAIKTDAVVTSSVTLFSVDMNLKTNLPITLSRKDLRDEMLLNAPNNELLKITPQWTTASDGSIESYYWSLALYNLNGELQIEYNHPALSQHLSLPQSSFMDAENNIYVYATEAPNPATEDPKTIIYRFNPHLILQETSEIPGIVRKNAVTATDKGFTASSDGILYLYHHGKGQVNSIDLSFLGDPLKLTQLSSARIVCLAEDGSFVVVNHQTNEVSAISFILSPDDYSVNAIFDCQSLPNGNVAFPVLVSNAENGENYFAFPYAEYQICEAIDTPLSLAPPSAQSSDSSLFLSLMGSGLVVSLVSVAAFSKWRERAHLRQLATASASVATTALQQITTHPTESVSIPNLFEESPRFSIGSSGLSRFIPGLVAAAASTEIPEARASSPLMLTSSNATSDPTEAFEPETLLTPKSFPVYDFFLFLLFLLAYFRKDSEQTNESALSRYIAKALFLEKEINLLKKQFTKMNFSEEQQQKISSRLNYYYESIEKKKLSLQDQEQNKTPLTASQKKRVRTFFKEHDKNIQAISAEIKESSLMLNKK